MQVSNATPNRQDESLPPAERSPSLADGTPRQLDPRFIQADAIAGWITTAVLSGLSLPILFFTWFMGWLPTWAFAAAAGLWLILTLTLIWLTPRFPRWVYRTTRYLVRPEGVEIHRGIIWKSIINVPRSRVQHTDVTQGPILRRFGLATLTLYTAGTHHSAVELSGIAHETAIRIRDFLLHGDDGDAA